MAIEIHGQITASGVRVFIKIHKYVASSLHQLIRRLNNLNRFVVGRRWGLTAEYPATPKHIQNPWLRGYGATLLTPKHI